MNENLFNFTSTGGGSPAQSSPAQVKDLFSFEKINSAAAGSGISYTNRDSASLLTAQKDFNPYGFNPSDPVNFERLASKETFGSALMKGLDSFSYKFGNTFVDYWKDYGRMASALVNMDWGKMIPDEETMLQQYYRDQMDMQKNHVFVDPEDEDGIFNKRFLSEFIGNAGFALGTFAGISVEMIGDALIAAGTGGAGSGMFAATMARLGMKAAVKQGVEAGAKKSAGYLFDDVLRGFTKANGSVDDILQTGKASLKKIQEAKAIATVPGSTREEIVGSTFKIFSKMFDITKAKSLDDLGRKVLEATPVLGTGIDFGRKLSAGSKAGLSGGELFGMGLQGVRRMAQELNMSSTEAGFEAVSTYGDTLHQMISGFEYDNGRPPSDVELREMESLAMKAASGNYNTNMAILMATNKIQFGNLFNKYTPANRFMRDVLETANPTTLTVGTKALTQVYQKGKFGTMGLLGKISKDFGKKEAAYQLTKSVLKNTAKFEVTEGIQENLQETSAEGWKNYFLAKHAQTELTLSRAFELGLEDQFSKQGLKTFLMGAMTGMIVSGPTRLTNIGIQALNNKVNDMNYSDPKTNPRLKAEKEFDTALEELNTRLKEISTGKFNERSFNFAAQMGASMDATEAASKNLEYEFQNAKDDAFVSAVISAKRTGSVKALVQAVRNMGETMSDEEFRASFGVDLKDTKYSSVNQFADSVASKLDKFSQDVDDIRATVGKMVDPREYEDNSRDQYVAGLIRQSQEEAVMVLATDMLKGNLAAERAKQIASEMMSNPGLGSSADTAVRILSDGAFVESEVGILTSEIKQLEKQLGQVDDAGLKKDLNERLTVLKEKEKLMKVWLDNFEYRDKILTNEETKQKSNQGRQYGRFVGKETKTEVVSKQKDEATGEEKEVKSVQVAFDPRSQEIRDTFHKLLNVLNKESGVGTEVSEKTLQDVFDKFVDYLQLNQDVKDYMSAVEVLSNPDRMRTVQSRIVDGNFRFRIYSGLNMIEEMLNAIGGYEWINRLQNLDPELGEQIYDDLFKLLTEMAEYKELVELLAQKDLGYSSFEKGFELLNKIGPNLKKLIPELRSKYDTRDYTQVPKALEMENFEQNGVVDDERMNQIALDLLEAVEGQTPEDILDKETELKMYEKKKGEIDAIVTNLREKRAAEAEAKNVTNPVSDPEVNVPEAAPEIKPEEKTEPDDKPDPEVIPEPEKFDLTKTATQILTDLLPKGEVPTLVTIAEMAKKINDLHFEHVTEDQLFAQEIDVWVKDKGKDQILKAARELLTERKEVKPAEPVVSIMPDQKTPTSMAEMPGVYVIPMNILENFDKELVEINRKALQNPANNRKFVEEGPSLETQALNYLNDILTCGK